jgi:hypothetical protein
MAVLTKYRLAEEIMKLLNAGKIQAAYSHSFNEIIIAIGQVANSMLKLEHLNVNMKMGEMVPNGAALGLYEGIAVTSYGTGRSKATLPVKPIKLPRNMGVFAIYPKYESLGAYDLDNEFIPLQMGQGGLLKSQPMISDLFGQVGYENFGLELVFNKDLKLIWPDITLAMRLVILDINEYDEYDPLPLSPDMEWQIKKEVLSLYMNESVADKLIDSSTKDQQGVPLNQQKQS